MEHRVEMSPLGDPAHTTDAPAAAAAAAAPAAAASAAADAPPSVTPAAPSASTVPIVSPILIEATEAVAAFRPAAAASGANQLDGGDDDRQLSDSPPAEEADVLVHASPSSFLDVRQSYNDRYSRPNGSGMQQEYVYEDEHDEPESSQSCSFPQPPGFATAAAAAVAAAAAAHTLPYDTHVTYGTLSHSAISGTASHGSAQQHLSSTHRTFLDVQGNEVRERVHSMPISPLYGTETDIVRMRQPNPESRTSSILGEGPHEADAAATDPASKTHRPDLTLDLEAGGAAIEQVDREYIYTRQHPLDSARGEGHGAGTSLAAPHLTTLGEAVPKAIFSPCPQRNGSGLATPRTTPPLKVPGAEDAVAHPFGTWLTCALLLAHLALFLVEFGVDEWSMESWYVNPTGGPSYDTLDRLGAKNTFKILGMRHRGYGAGIDRTSEGWRLIVPIFWHAGIVSFIPAMAALAWLGRSMEREYGPARLGVVWFVSAIFGTVFSALMSVDLLTVTGSAGIFALLGARALDLWLYRRWYKHNALTAVALVLATAAGLVLGLLPLIDNWAHVGAGVMGALIAGVLFTGGWRSAPEAGQTLTPHTRARRAELDHTRRYNKVRFACLVLLLLAWALVLGLLFGAVSAGMTTKVDPATLKRVTSVWCTGCNQFQCMEAPAWTCRPSYYD